jgi:hypothetical protein
MYVIKTLTGEEVKLLGYKIPYDAFESSFMRSLSKKFKGEIFKYSEKNACTCRVFIFNVFILLFDAVKLLW